MEARLGDCIGFLNRTRSRLHITVAQVVKAISYLASATSKAMWATERKARRVVGREYAIQVLQEMASCRPPPPFAEQERELICSIAFDQTYKRMANTSFAALVSSFCPRLAGECG